MRILFKFEGYPIDDRSEWTEFVKIYETSTKPSLQYYQNLLNHECGYPETVDPEQFLFLSPYFNIYGFPLELDYMDIVKLPDNFIRLDAFCRYEIEQFEFPDEFRSKIQPKDKLIYLSLGSLGSCHVELMNRLINELSRAVHTKCIVSMGPLHERIQLADNMWGKPYLPQPKILPLVDLVITHGGNNTITETCMAGKPMIVIPLFVDQYDNAQRIQDKGYGYRLDQNQSNETELLTMIAAIFSDYQMQKRCTLISERLRCSKSKQKKACEKIEQFVMQFKSE